MNNERTKVKTWKNKEGNLCFSFNMKDTDNNPLLIVAITVCLGIIGLIEYFYFKTAYCICPLSIASILFYMYWCYDYPCRKNELVEKFMMNKNVDLRLHNELAHYEKNVYEVERRFYQETIGTYGIVKGIYMLVLLSNGVILEYELKYHKPTKTQNVYFEFLKHPVICKDPKHIKVIEPRRLFKRCIQSLFTENVKLLFITLGIIGIGTFFIALYLRLTILYGINFLIIAVGSLIFFLWLDRLIGKSNNKLVRNMVIITSLPLVFIRISLNLMFPAVIVLFSYMYLVIFSFGLPLIIVSVLNYLFSLNMLLDTKLFMTLAVGSIISVYGAMFIHWIIREHSILKNYENHKYEAVKVELALYLIHEKNVNFLIYLLYFIFFSVSGFMQIQYAEPLITNSIDSAILNAFLVFMAFSNMVKNSKSVELKIKPLMEKIIRLITTHDS